MFYISEILTSAPAEYSTPLQEKVYQTLSQLNVLFERVDTDEAVTMEDTILINEKLDMKMVKTLFLCNRQQTLFYLFVTVADKPFKSKDFSTALEISRVSFASGELMAEILGTKIGAATVFSALFDTENRVRIVFDKDVLDEEYYGCSDGTTRAFLKIKTKDITEKILEYTKHPLTIIEM
jgi:Ala-tRNA(Pro) deacylase